MVRLQIKRGAQNQFIYETTVQVPISQLVQEVTSIFNGRLKIGRITAEMEELAKHGPMWPPHILGLTEEQVDELKLVDEYEEKCTPMDGFQFSKDPIGRRNGRAPKLHMQKVLNDAVEEAKQMVSVKLVDSNVDITHRRVQNALDILRGAVTIVYPMQLPPHDNIRMEFTNTEDLDGTQASLEIVEPSKAELWFAGHHMLAEKRLSDYVGDKEKTKVIVKLVRLGEGQPGREPVMSEEARKQIMLHEYRRQEELKKLDQNDDDSFLNSRWADNSSMKKQMHGLDNLKFRPGF